MCTPPAVARKVPAGTSRPAPVEAYFFSMFHIGGTDGTVITPLILSER
ncbi:hypothetical protein EDC65_1925 [Stella humosa]|uniref:Uncharacterized protein n=1 Tax=Stella humosa TaxID=94 RepID=A0A3N1MA59_9PROT|nr:hypothetical protein EDC65_1925 [Stella humosa]